MGNTVTMLGGCVDGKVFVVLDGVDTLRFAPLPEPQVSQGDGVPSNPRIILEEYVRVSEHHFRYVGTVEV